MKAKIFSLLLMAIASVLPFTLQSCSDDDDDTPAIGTSYWSAKDLKGHWIQFLNYETDRVYDEESYFDFRDNGTFTQVTKGLDRNYYDYGKFSAPSSYDPQEISVQYDDTDEKNLWEVWSIEWLTSDKTEMRFGSYYLKKTK